MVLINPDLNSSHQKVNRAIVILIIGTYVGRMTHVRFGSGKAQVAYSTIRGHQSIVLASLFCILAPRVILSVL